MSVRSRRWLLAASAAAWLLSAAVHASAPAQLPQPEPAQPADLPAGDGSAIARARCLACHGADMILQQRLPRAAWDRELGKMIAWGAAVQDAERQPLLDYLATAIGQPPPLSAAAQEAGAAILRNRCLTCHTTSMMEPQRLTGAGWSREVEKMRSWGAGVTDDEKAPLVEYLASAPWNARR